MFLKSEYSNSIKRQLISSVSIVVTIVLFVSLYLSYISAKHEVEEVYDSKLGQSAKLMLLTLSLSDDQHSIEFLNQQYLKWMEHISESAKQDSEKATLFGHPYEENLVFQYYHGTQLLWSSTPELGRLSKLISNNGFSDISLGDDDWRVFQISLPDQTASNQYMVVGEKISVRQEIIGELVLSAALQHVLLLPTLLLLLLFFIRRAFKPLDELKQAITKRNIDRLDHIHLNKNYVELSPLVESLNLLLTKLESAWQRERRFTRAAAHELKTPLTILRLNAENALLSRDEMERNGDLNNILLGIDRTDRLIQQLLMQAKVDSTTDRLNEVVDIKLLLQSILSDLAPLALKNNQELSLCAEDISVRGDRMLLDVLFRNLIDNAIRYSGNGSSIDVSAYRKDEKYIVEVTDNGSPIAREIREQIFEPFFRGHTEKGDGAGLGMSICKDIAEHHGATLSIAVDTDELNKFVIEFSG